MKTYRINPGYSYRDGAGVVRQAGELIELADDVVAQQPNSVALVVEDEAAAESTEEQAAPEHIDPA